jgi:hypothetical protein
MGASTFTKVLAPTTSTSDGGPLTGATKILISAALSFVLLLIFVVVFIAPKWNDSLYSPVYWEAQDQKKTGLTGRLLTNDLEWDNLDGEIGSLADGSPGRIMSPFISGLVAPEPTADVDTGTARVNYRAMQDNELSLIKGELLLVHSAGANMPGWVYATNENQQTGLVQTVMVEPLSHGGQLMDLSTLAMPDQDHARPESAEAPELGIQDVADRRVSGALLGAPSLANESTSDYIMLKREQEAGLPVPPSPTTLV